jgi:lactosylceramide 4-alpha-galactosyltransferase
VIGYEDDTGVLNGAVMMFDRENEFIKACLLEFFSNFNGNVWGYNGPKLVTRVYNTKSKEHTFSTEVVRSVPREMFYPYYYWDVYDCFNQVNATKVRQRMRALMNQTYVLHYNNHFTSALGEKEGSVCRCLLNAFCVTSNCTGCADFNQQTTAMGHV